jgi:hypothetical protein
MKINRLYILRLKYATLNKYLQPETQQLFIFFMFKFKIAPSRWRVIETRAVLKRIKDFVLTRERIKFF